MQCAKCKIQLADDAQICSACGTHVVRKAPSRWRRWKKSILFLVFECGLFLIFFTVVLANKMAEPETAMRAFLESVAAGHTEHADQYLADHMRIGAFAHELSWFVSTANYFPEHEDIAIAHEGEGHGEAKGEDEVEVTINLRGPDRNPFPISLIMRNIEGRWIIVAPKDHHIADPYFNNGGALLHNRQPERAELEFRKGLLIDPANVMAHIDLARSIQLSGLNARDQGAHSEVVQRYTTEALFEFRVGTDLDPQEPSAHYYLALTYRDDNQFDKAVDEFRTAIKLGPNSAYAHKYLADVLRQRNTGDDLKEALQEFHLACQMNDQDACQSWNEMSQAASRGDSTSFPNHDVWPQSPQ